MNQVVDVTNTMDFPDAIRQVIAGKKIYKLEWMNNDYAVLEGSWLYIVRDGIKHRWLINDGDLLGEDWVVVE